MNPKQKGYLIAMGLYLSLHIPYNMTNSFCLPMGGRNGRGFTAITAGRSIFLLMRQVDSLGYGTWDRGRVEKQTKLIPSDPTALIRAGLFYGIAHLGKGQWETFFFG